VRHGAANKPDGGYMDKVLIEKANELVTLDEQAKALANRIDELKGMLKDALPVGTHVLGCAVVTIKEGSNSHIDKDAVCAFFNVERNALEPFTKRTSFTSLSVKRANIKAE
jgi:hypothetical protein